MERKVWVVAAVGFASALAIYGTSATHGQRADGGRLGRLARLEALMDEGKVQYRPSFFRKKVQVRIEKEQIAGLEPVKTVTEIAPPAVKDDAAKKAADKKAADEKKKKEDEAKKKKEKKKKKKGEKGGEAITPAPSSDKDEKKPSDPSTDNGGNLNPGNGAFAGGGAYDPNKTPESIEDWLKYLTQNATFEKVTKFIQLKQIGSVKDEVFYPVIEKMITMNVGSLRSFAVMALGSTPSLPSFEALFAIGNEPSMDDKTRSSAVHFLKIYNRVDYVQILATAAGVQNNVPLNNFAISQIAETLNTNLEPATVSATTPDPSATSTTPTPRAPASSAVKRYEAVAAALHAAANSATDASVRSNAESVASRIDGLIPG